ncbi:MAG: GAF domain-containing protein [Bacteroidota bacterium]|nr:GAF domain-containing protein [Bacteroidota bacterium]
MNVKKLFSISNRVLTAFIIIASVISFVSIICIIKLNKSYMLINQNHKANILTYYLRDLRSMVRESQRLTNNLVIMFKQEDKNRLIKIHDEEFPELRTKINNDLFNYSDKKENDSIQNVLMGFEPLISMQKRIINKLNLLNNNSDSINDKQAIIFINKELNSRTSEYMAAMTNQINYCYNLNEENYKIFIKANRWMTGFLKYMIAIVIVISIAVYYLTRKIITKPLNKLRGIVLSIGKGKLTGIDILNKRNSLLDGYQTDELGQMGEAVKELIEGLKTTADFAKKIGEGNLNTSYKPLSEDDELGNSLLEMRSSLQKALENEKKNKIEDEKRNWATMGLARIGEILRQNNDDEQKLFDNVISWLIKYMGVNQGGLFLINDENKEDKYIQLVAAYAYNKKKYIEKRIEIGEGIIGQCVLEGDKIYITELPSDYLEITSGLGYATPKCLLVVPLKINDEIHGVVEIASFEELEKYKIDFVEKLSESIASTISGVKTNFRTKKLLQQSMEQEQAIRAQEEEMRQNMEELKATQEEAYRKTIEMEKLLLEAKEKEDMLRSQEEMLSINMEEMTATQEQMNFMQEEMRAMNTITDQIALVSKTDLRGNITYVNDEFVKWSKYSRAELTGKNHRIFKSGHQSDDIFVELWETITSGKVFRADIKNKAKDGSYYWVDEIVAPVMDDYGKPVEYIAQRYIINDRKEKEEETRQRIEKLEQENMELKIKLNK